MTNIDRRWSALMFAVPTEGASTGHPVTPSEIDTGEDQVRRAKEEAQGYAYLDGTHKVVIRLFEKTGDGDEKERERLTYDSVRGWIPVGVV